MITLIVYNLFTKLTIINFVCIVGMAMLCGICGQKKFDACCGCHNVIFFPDGKWHMRRLSAIKMDDNNARWLRLWKTNAWRNLHCGVGTIDFVRNLWYEIYNILMPQNNNDKNYPEVMNCGLNDKTRKKILCWRNKIHIVGA